MKRDKETAHSPGSGEADGNPLAGKRILVVDDHPAIRKGLTATLEPEPDMEIVGESYGTNRDKDPFFKKEVVTGLAQGFLDGADPRDPGVNGEVDELLPTQRSLVAEQCGRRGPANRRSPMSLPRQNSHT